MNKVYKLVWNRVRNCYMAVAEIAKSKGKAGRALLAAGIVIGTIGMAMPAMAADNPVLYDDDTYATITLEGESVGLGTKITNLADGELSAASTDAVTGAQLYAAQQQFDEFQSALSINNGNIANVQTDVNTMKTNYLNLNSDVNTLKTQMETGFNVTIDGAKVKTVNPDSNLINFIAGDNISITNQNGSIKISATGGQGGGGGSDDSKANKDASNVSDYTAEWGESIGTGAVESGNGELVTGGTVYDALEDVKTDMNDKLDAKADKDDVYTKDETDTLLDGKADKDDVYTKTETDTLLDEKADKSELDAKADKDEVYTKDETDTKLDAKADKDDVYTKTETDTLLDDKADKTYVDDGLAKKADKDSVYTKDETDDKLDKKADKSSVYTKKETDDKLDKKANVDASNIDTAKWAEKLGTGEVVEGDTNLVTGDTVAKALADVDGTDLISKDDEAGEIRIGAKDKYTKLDAVNITDADGNSRILRGVKTDPTDGTSAASVEYVQGEIAPLRGSIHDLDTRLNKVGASAAAMANLHPLDWSDEDKWNVALSYGHYKGENAAAAGVFYRPSENVMINISGAFGGENMIGAGISFGLDGKAKHSGTRKGMAYLMKRINEMQAEIDELRASNQAKDNLLQSIYKEFTDVPKAHWAYNNVSRLHGNGVLAGYPDGTFRGDKYITRYEYAEALAKALNKVK